MAWYTKILDGLIIISIAKRKPFFNCGTVNVCLQLVGKEVQGPLKKNEWNDNHSIHSISNPMYKVESQNKMMSLHN